MKRIKCIVTFIIASFLSFTGCQTTIDSGSSSSTAQNEQVGYYVDDPIVNIDYVCGTKQGKTEEDGSFFFEEAKECHFYVGSVLLRTIPSDKLKKDAVFFENDLVVSAFLQSLDKNHMYGSTIEVDEDVKKILKDLGITTIPKTQEARATLIQNINAYLPLEKQLVAVMDQEAQIHMQIASYSYVQQPNVYFTKDIFTPTTINYSATNSLFTQTDFVLLAWSDTGMHCMDGDYSVFSLLPPNNTLKAQFLVKGASPRIVNAGVEITYEALADNNGLLNTTNIGKTNFWDYAAQLYPSLRTLQDGMGVAGKQTQSLVPQTMDYNLESNLYIAPAIPNIPVADDGSSMEYTPVKVVAKTSDGTILATTQTVLPASTEMDCKKCHGESNTKMDILEKHDRNFPNAVKDHQSELQAKGYNYDENGLAVTAQNGTSILCASCHKDNAVAQSGIDGIPALSEAIHGAHASRTDPDSGELLGISTNRDSCYACHPGKSTQCLRGVMGSNGVECQDCHGTMNAVAQHSREGWSDEPNCQSCHQDGKRYDQAVTDLSTGTLRAALDQRFATETTPHDTHPKLYKESHGHGGMACAACHGAQHAIYPSSVAEENVQSQTLQGYAGTIRECGVCHKEGAPFTANQGPHGMHTIGQEWVNKHGTIVLRKGTNDCKSCHGSNLNGSALSKVPAKRVFAFGVTDKYVEFQAGEEVGCTSCHQENLMGAR